MPAAWHPPSALGAQIPVYICATEEEGQFQPGRCARWWLQNSLQSFQEQLAALGSRLILRKAPDSCSALVQLVQETGARALLFNHLYDPISMVRDNEAKAAMLAANVYCQSFNGDVLVEPWEILSPSGTPLTSYDSYWERCAPAGAHSREQHGTCASQRCSWPVQQPCNL